MPRDHATRRRSGVSAPAPRDKLIRDIADTYSSFSVQPSSKSSATQQPAASGSPKQAGMPRKRLIPKKRPPRKKKQTYDERWEIKGILDQREVDGQAQYLVDWEDHPVTGEVYPHEWRIKADLSEESIAQWEEANRQQTADSLALERDKSLNQTNEGSDPDSQEPQPANRRRRPSLPLGKRPRPRPKVLHDEGDSSDADRAPKRIRLASDNSVGSEPSCTTSAATVSEDPESPKKPTGTRCQVILHHKSDFDPSEYRSVTLTQTQSTQVQLSQSVSTLESQDQSIVLSTGHISSQRTVPDSQEVSSLETQATGPSGLRAVSQRHSQDSAPDPVLAPALLSNTLPDPLRAAISEVQADVSVEVPQSKPIASSNPQVQISEEGGREEESIPSHQPEQHPRFDSWAFNTSQSRVAMSTPRASQGLPGFGEQPLRQGEPSASASVHLPQQAQPPVPSERSLLIAAERARLDAISVSSSEDESEAGSTGEVISESGAEDEDAYGLASVSTGHRPVTATVAPTDIESAQRITEIPILPSIGLSSHSVPVPHASPTLAQLVTLPLLANCRKAYIKLIVVQQDLLPGWLDSLAEAFDAEEELDNEALFPMDVLFTRLQGLCDDPTGLTCEELLALPHDQRMKFLSEANPKWYFLYELLRGIEDTTLKLLLVAPAPQLPLLCDLMDYVGTVNYTCSALDRVDARPFATTHVTICSLNEKTEVGVDAWDADVVVAYNMAFNGSAVEQKLMGDTRGRKRPLLLKLAISQSIEHADIAVRDIDDPPIESSAMHKYLLLRAIWENRDPILHPPQAMIDKAHRVAESLCSYLRDDVDWEDVDMDPDTFVFPVESVWKSAQSLDAQLEPDGGHSGKRQRDEGNEEDGQNSEEPKRSRRYSQALARAHANIPSPPLSRDIRQFLEKGGWTGVTYVSHADTLSVPLSVLDSLRAQFTDIERQATDLTAVKQVQESFVKQVRQQEAEQNFYNRFSEKYRKATEDLNVAKNAAEKAKEQTVKKDKTIESQQQTITKLKDELLGLMTGTATPETVKALKRAEARVKDLEKRLENAKKDEEYVRGLYQDASAKAGAASAKVNELEEKEESLQQQADERRVEIQRINSDNTSKALQQQITQLQTELEFSKLEKDRLYEENRQLKARRETRGNSAPRSPRPGLMSPRGRGAPGPGPLSREVSPVPGGFPPPGSNGSTGLQYTNPNGGSRWGRGTVP